jgi:hypothetical protein
MSRGAQRNGELVALARVDPIAGFLENAMALRRLLTTPPFGVSPADDGGIRLEDPKTGQIWLLTNQQTRDFARLISHRRKIAEKTMVEKENLPLKLSATPFCQGLPGSISGVAISCEVTLASSPRDTTRPIVRAQIIRPRPAN